MTATSDPQLEQALGDLREFEARDRILTALRRQPWVSLERVSELARLEEDLVEPVLDGLLDEDLVDSPRICSASSSTPPASSGSRAGPSTSTSSTRRRIE